ncbi:MAG: SDR family NAD(P)-dependent oxidoreductase [Albidovulum sp.]|nr:SDR family NAD(P)-dependent oxidoreductase [Albidovulum sp.]MDE0307127.1 SDR family NAD(P)-dependent oxidoreductase [Albidovulum sp.]MDE0531725.1 SDR family NAD(P)-dependent oxidoreductase [Albidovulum sp.]
MENRKVALITGAGSGIGRAAALALHTCGFQVVLVGRNRGNLVETAALSGSADRFLVCPTDVTDEKSVDAAFELVTEKLGRLDLLFNNAGIGTPSVQLDELKIADWRKCIDVNLTGSFLCARKAFGIMKRQLPKGGRIVNNGSISATAPRANSTAYTSSKHAISGLTKSIALDGRPHDICCSQIDIGNAGTALTQGFGSGALQADGSIAPEPVFDVKHCGEAVAYLASLPLTANILFMTIMATKMPFVGRG